MFATRLHLLSDESAAAVFCHCISSLKRGWVVLSTVEFGLILLPCFYLYFSLQGVQAQLVYFFPLTTSLLIYLQLQLIERSLTVQSVFLSFLCLLASCFFMSVANYRLLSQICL